MAKESIRGLIMIMMRLSKIVPTSLMIKCLRQISRINSKLKKCIIA